MLTALATAADGASAQSPAGALSGFLLDRGRYITIATPRAGEEAVALGLNDHGTIVGEYIIDDRQETGFLRDKRGRITRFLVPGARGTEANKINNRGQIVGTYSDDTPIVNDSARPRAFLLDRGQFTRIDVPGAVSTLAHGVNDRGQVVGAYLDADGGTHGFLWDKRRFTTIDVPGSVGTNLGDISNRGEIVGVYGDDPDDPTGATGSHGFLLSRGVFTTFDAPGVPFTQPFGINDRGQIAGSTASDLARTEAHGFLLATGVEGTSARSTSRARPGLRYSTSTIAARSSAPTRTPMPRRSRASHADADDDVEPLTADEPIGKRSPRKETT